MIRRFLPILVASIACGMDDTKAADRVVINEIHFNPSEKKPHEFVELFNAGDQPAKMDGWRLDKFVFPAGTVLAPGAHLVVAQEPQSIERDFGVKALGRLSGKLSNEGEKLTLTNAAGGVVDVVRYGVGFPWPSASAGLGSSIERVHPLLDGNVPSNWRASGFPVAERGDSPALIPPGSGQWRWRKGDKPADQWIRADYKEGGEWATGKAGFGYGDDDDATVIADMSGRFSCIQLRHRVTVKTVPAAIRLRVRVDDGCVIWINGREAARFHVPAGDVKPETLAAEHEAGDWEEILLQNADKLLVAGENILAVQVMNSAKDSSDLSFDMTLDDAANTAAARTAPRRPTPGLVNSASAGMAMTAPGIISVRHFPVQPKPGEPVRVLAEIAKGTVRAATLRIQVVEPGAYIRRTDPEYEARWQDVPMQLTAAGWMADLPGAVQKNRCLVRYRIVAEGPDGSRVRAPYSDDPSPNFAYYVWAGPAAWAGASEPGKTPVLNFSSQMQQTLQTFTLLARNDDVERSQWDGGYHKRRMLGTFVYEGRVLDHIEYNNRGSGSTYVAGKNKWGFHFLPGHDLPMRDQWGRPYKNTWNSFAMNGCATPWMQINRGMAGLDEAIGFRAYQLAGVPASDCIPVQFRVVSTTEERGKSQYEGDVWGLYQAIEDVDGAWLDNHGWPDGLVYKPEDGVKHKPSGFNKDPGAEWGSFQGGPSGDKVKWWRDRMDMQSYYSFHSINRLVGNVDIRPGANHAFYQHPQKGWMPVPWDLDMMFIPRTHQPGFIDQIACLDQPALKVEFQNRGREIMDLMGSDPSPNGGQMGQLVAEYARHIEPPATRGKPEWSWAMLDMCRWNHSPRTNDRGAYYRNPWQQDMFGGRFSRTLATPDFMGFCRYVTEYSTDSRPKKDYQPNDGNPLGYGYGFLFSECRDGQIPATPTVKRTAGYTFTASPFSDPQGAQTFAGIQWRIGEIGQTLRGPWNYEITPVWTSEILPAEGATANLPGYLMPSRRVFRVRARYLDNTGRWSHWSPPVQIGP